MINIRQYIQHIKFSINKHPYLWSVFISFLYILLFQYNFISGGDAWAESFAEYLDESIRKGWGDVLKQNWAGYFTILPSFLSKAYISLNGPVGFADYYYRFIVVIFTILTCSIISLKYFRNSIEQDILRILLSLSLILILFDVASFSFINIWYIGYIPIFIYCLTTGKASNSLDAFMGIFGFLIVLSKPFIFIFPFLIYRIIKTKQYFGASLVLIGAILQTVQILFNDQRNIIGDSDINLKQSIGGLIVGSSTSVLKIIGLGSATYITVVICLLILLILAYTLYRIKGFWIFILLCSLYIFSIYTYILAPDSSVYFGIKEINKTLYFNLKSQREIIPNATLLITIFIISSHYYRKKYFFKHAIPFNIITILLILIMLLFVYKPIDTQSPGLSSEPLNYFRGQLNRGEPTCVPLAPNVFYFVNTEWSFGYKGKCHTLTNDTNLFLPDTSEISYGLEDGLVIYDAKNFRLQDYNLQAIVVPINYKGISNCNAYLKNMADGKIYETQIANNKKHPQLITFNTSGMTTNEKYILQISTNCSEDVLVGKFSPNQEIMTYPYFLQID